MRTFSKPLSAAALAAACVVPVGGDLAFIGSASAAESTQATVTGATVASSTNVRTGPSTSTKVVARVKSGTLFTGTASNGWLHINSGAYNGKYVSLSVLKLTTSSAPVLQGSEVVRQTVYPTTNVRTSASTSSAVAGHLALGTTITGTLSNGWVKVSTPAQYAGKYVSDSVLGANSATGTSSTPAPAAPVYVVTSPFSCSTNPTLASGSTGDCVKAVQNTLNSWMIRTNAAGGQLMTVSGSYGSVTVSDLKLFQKANGLPETGKVDSETWKALASASQSTGKTATASISGAPGDTHPAFPSAIRLTDGRLMIVFTSAKKHTNNTTPSTTWKTYSADGGYSWTTPEQIKLPNGMENTPAGLGIATSGPLAGRPILTTWSVDSKGMRHTQVVLATDNGGTTWGQPLDLNAVPQGSSFSASPIVQVNDTDFQQAVYVYAGSAHSHASTVGLTYDGTTFVVGPPSTIAEAVSGTDTEGSDFSEVGMAKLDDGRLISLIRHDTKTAKADIYQSYSSDGGKTWSPAYHVFYGSGAPRIAKTPDGRLVVVYRHMNGPSDTGAQQAGAMDAVYRVSDDNGATWGAEHPLNEHAPFEMAYGTPLPNPDGTVTIVYANEASGTSSHLVTDPNKVVTK